MRSLLDYAGFAKLYGRYPIMRKIVRAHNRINPRSLVDGAISADVDNDLSCCLELMSSATRRSSLQEIFRRQVM